MKKKQSYKIRLGKTIRKDPHDGFIVTLSEHNGNVITTDDFRKEKPGLLSIRSQLSEARIFLGERQIIRGDNPFDDKNGYVRQFNDTVEKMLDNYPDDERLLVRLKILTDLLKPLNMPEEEMVGSHFPRQFSHALYALAFDPGITYKKEGPLLAGDVLDHEMGKTIQNDELGRNLFAVNNPIHPALVAISALRMSDDNYPAYLSLARMKNPDEPGGVSKFPIITVLNPDLDDLSADPLAVLCPLGRDFPVTDSIEIFSDRAVMSWLLSESGFSRIIRMTERRMNEANLKLEDGELFFMEDGRDLIAKVSSVIGSDDFSDSIKAAGSDFAEAFRLWPDIDKESHSHIKIPFDSAMTELGAFCHALLGASREFISGLPEIIGLQPSKINDHVRNVNAAEGAQDLLSGPLKKAVSEYKGDE
jgi:hypothetical protein